MKCSAKFNSLLCATGLLVFLLAFLTFLCPSSMAIVATLTDDTHTASGNAKTITSNFGNSPTLQLQDQNTGKRQDVYLKYDLLNLPGCPSACPLPQNILKAKLTLYVSKVIDSGTFDVVSLRPNFPWEEKTLTFASAAGSNHLGLIEAANVPISAETVDKFITIDLTALVQAWVNGEPNNGIVLRADIGSRLEVEFDSKENKATAHEPVLEIELAGVGSVGSQGPVGPQGPIGPTGAQGVPGPVGPIGPQGIAGPQGAVGPTGTQGSQGVVGPIGATGSQGPIGPIGLTFQGPWSSSNPYNERDIVTFGGQTWFATGTIAPTLNSPGLDPAWALLAATGATGPEGPIGQLGPQGATGGVGPAGPTGSQGAQGVPGPIGPTGATGTTGLTGPIGPQGNQGAQGNIGPQGLIGPMGPAGSANITGTVNSIVKFAGLSTGGDSQIYDDSANVGIGTTNPNAKLDVAGDINTSSHYNIAGIRVFSLPGTNFDNIAVGIQALQNNTNGAHNTAFGNSALALNTDGTGNTAVGASALVQNRTGLRNTAIGGSAMQNNASGSDNTAIGSGALLGSSDTLISNVNINHNTAVGSNALMSNRGDYNTGIGSQSLSNNRVGTENTAVGRAALFLNETGNYNTAVGSSALWQSTSGEANTAIGTSTLYNNKEGSGNIAVGHGTLYLNSTGNGNTATGVRAMGTNTSGGGNTASGFSALEQNGTGEFNTAIGGNSLFGNGTGSNNTALGYGADVSVFNLTNATAIGANTIVNASNKIRLGNSLVTVIEGQVPFSFSSDKTKKENFRLVDGEEILRKIRDLSLMSWNFIGHDPEKFRHYGPMAQEFFAAFGRDEVGTIGTPLTINSGDLAGIMMIAIKALEQRASELKAKQASLETVAARLETLEIKLNLVLELEGNTPSRENVVHARP